MYQNIKHPSSKDWIMFFEQLFLWLAGISFISGIGFFIAYNWNEFGKFFKFLLIEGLMVISIGITLIIKNKWISNISLFVASFLVGVFMALFGQVYQTQADSWELFFYWALLIFPWVWINRFIGNWLLWFLLLELVLVLYEPAFNIYTLKYNLFWELFAFNTLALFFWEYISKKFDIKYSFLVYKMLFILSTFSITVLMFETDLILPISVWILWIIGVYYFYRIRSISIYTLSVMSVSIVIVVDVLLIRGIDKMHIHNLMLPILMIGLITISLGALLVNWLKDVSKEANNVFE